MTSSIHAVLVSLVERYDGTDGPVTPEGLAASCDRSADELCRTLARFRAVDLAAREGSGYRPTVTTRELLAAGIDLDGAVALDPVEGE